MTPPVPRSADELRGWSGSRPETLLYVFGTRPNFVKMAPVLRELRLRLPASRHVVVHTGQHYDREMSEIFLAELGVPPPDHLLGVGSGSHGAQTARALERIEGVLLDERPELVVVPGDVNSSLAGALAAVKLGIPVAHIEAGLRSFDRTMPEEINRILVDQVSRWCFTHSPEADENLAREGVESERVFRVGNTMIDTLARMWPRIYRSTVHERLGLPQAGYLLVTLHRPALVDGALLVDALRALDRLSRELPVVFPMHPRTRSRADGFRATSRHLNLLDPVGYIDFLALESRAAGLITDSGGVQEETTYLGVPCFTLRENTERPVTIEQGTNRLLGLSIEGLLEIPELLDTTAAPLRPPAGWDGRAAERVADALLPDSRSGAGDEGPSEEGMTPRGTTATGLG
jgi:UDP-N-acetylglucosamine 2-epimerase (non-hydrolysing)